MGRKARLGMCVNRIPSYGGPTEALSKLLEGEGVAGPCLITSTTAGIKKSEETGEFFSVQVTCKDKSIYRIEAYGEEAVELLDIAKLHHAPIGPAGLTEASESVCRHEYCHLERIKNKNYKCDLYCSF